jgi:hypothetical protein
MKSLAILAAGAMASAASGQEWRFELSNPVLSPDSPSTTVTAPFGGHPGQDPGVIDGASVVGISVGQLLRGWEPRPGRINVWQATFTVTDFTPRQIDANTETDRFEVYLDRFGAREPRIPIEGSAIIRVIPAPGVLAFFGAAGVFTVSRRRGRARCHFPWVRGDN